MALFSKRPLAWFCFLFFACSFAAGYAPVAVSWIGASVFGALALLCFLIPKIRQRILGVGLCFCVVAFSLLHSFLLTELPRIEAKKWIGQRMALCQVTEKVEAADYFSYARVRILNLDGESVNIDGYINCDFLLEAQAGDRIYAYATVEETGAESERLFVSRKDQGGAFLSVYVENADHGVIHRLSEDEISLSTIAEPSGVRILSIRWRDRIRGFLCEGVGERIGPVAGGFLLGDTEGISPSVLRDFRRTGTFHLLSVSGLHLTVLLGAVEMLLRACFVPKRLRIGTVSLLALVFLAMAGFSSSACRSVLMLMGIYLFFMVAENSDGITVLFASAAVIVLFSPFATNDLGFWMSFQATLGLMTLFHEWERKRRKRSSKKQRKRMLPLRKAGYAMLSGLMMTVIANLFLLPILWSMFGELSWISPLCNVVMSPFSSLFLITIPIYLLLGWIPILGEGVAWIVYSLGEVLLWIVSRLSRFPRGVISLRYGFCSVIVLLLGLVMIVMLVIRLRRKWLMAIPPCMAVLAFLICLGGYHLLAEQESIYLQRGRQTETMAWCEMDRLAVCDLSGGGWRGCLSVQELLQESAATELDCLILSCVHEEHLPMVDALSQGMMIRAIYLPYPTDGEEAAWVGELARLASEQGIDVSFYRSGERISPWSGLDLYVESLAGEKHRRVALTARGERESLLYLSPNLSGAVGEAELSARTEQTETVILGSHGKWGERSMEISFAQGAKTKQILYGSSRLTNLFQTKNFDGEKLVPSEEKGRHLFRISLP